MGTASAGEGSEEAGIEAGLPVWSGAEREVGLLENTPEENEEEKEGTRSLEEPCLSEGSRGGEGAKGEGGGKDDEKGRPGRRVARGESPANRGTGAGANCIAEAAAREGKREESAAGLPKVGAAGRLAEVEAGKETDGRVGGIKDARGRKGNKPKLELVEAEFRGRREGEKEEEEEEEEEGNERSEAKST